MPPRDPYARLLWGLRRAVVSAGLTRAEAAARIGLSPGHLGRLLRGRDPLKADQLFAVLGALDLHPAVFFHQTFGRLPPPAAGAAGERAGSGEEGGWRSALPALLKVLEDYERRAQESIEVDLAAEPARLAGYLKLRIRAEGFKARGVSQAIGLAPDHLGQILRRNQRLDLERLFAVLEAIGVRPLDFFHAFYGLAGGLPDRSITDRLRFSDLYYGMRELAAAAGWGEGSTAPPAEAPEAGQPPEGAGSGGRGASRRSDRPPSRPASPGGEDGREPSGRR